MQARKGEQKRQERKKDKEDKENKKDKEDKEDKEDKADQKDKTDQEDKEDKGRKGRCARGLMMKIFPCGTPTSWYDTESVERFPNPANTSTIHQSTMAKRWTLELS